MRRIWIIVALCLWPLFLLAQDDDRGFLQRTLEDALSDAGREVRIVGFTGALSSSATLDELTIADDAGVWLTLKGVELDWARAALLRGRLEVTKLTAEEILLPRIPPSAGGGPAPEASGFALPELPVSIEIGEVSADRLSLGAPILGTAAELSVTGSLTLAEGSGTLDIEAARIDGKDGRFAVAAAFDNATENLSVDVELSEGSGGLVANLAGLPGRPALDLTLRGEAPLADFTAQLALSTDGEERLRGTLALAATEPNAPPGRVFRANIRGDIAPLFLPDYRAFFGPDVALSARGTQFGDGRLDLEAFEVSTAALELAGSALIGEGNLPLRLDIEGGIGRPDGTPVLLPLSGVPTEVRSVTLDVGFDAAQGNRWSGDIAVVGLDRPDLRAASLSLTGGGVINPGDAPRVTAGFDFLAEQLDLTSAAAGDALGEAVTGRADIVWSKGQPLELDAFRIIGETYALNADGIVTPGDGDLTFAGQAGIRAADLGVFTGLAGRALGGQAQLSVSGTGDLLGGAFDLAIEGTTRDLKVDQVQANRILAGEVTLGLAATRDQTGLRFEDLALDGDRATVTGSGALSSTAQALTLTARLADIADLEPRLSGPATLSVDAASDQGPWAGTLAIQGLGAELAFDGTLDLDASVPVIAGALGGQVADLSVLAPVLDRSVSGSVRLVAEGQGSTDAKNFDLTATLSGQDLAIGQTQADALLAGSSRLALSGARANDIFTLRQGTLTSPLATLEGAGQIGGATETALLKGEVKDLSQVLDGAVGPAALDLTANRDGGPWTADLSVEGSDNRLSYSGTVDLTGDVPALDGALDASIPDLAVLSPFVGRALGGAVELSASGRVLADGSVFDVSAAARGQNIQTAQGDLDRLLAGASTLILDGAREDGVIDLRRFEVASGALTATATGEVAGDVSTIEAQARLADLALFLPGFPGAATAQGIVTRQSDGAIGLDLRASGPGGLNATVAGTAAADFSSADLKIDGRGELSLANRFIAPRTLAGPAVFDLRLNGPLALASISGRATASGARLVDPDLGLVLEGVSAGADLSGNQANVDVAGAIRGGGRFTVAGPIGLAAPNTAKLAIGLRQASLSDPALYETTLTGDLSVSGPLAGGALIAGALSLGQTEIQVPSSGLSGASAIPDIVHVNEPAAVRATRARAGLLGDDTARRRGAAVAYPLDVRVSATNRIFVRGRGLDAELGGGLRLAGTTADIVPDGQFDLIRGRLDILGRRLNLTEGRIQLQGGLDPLLFFMAETEAEDVTVRILIEGTASEPLISFQSSPELPEDEVLARLLFGRGVETLSPVQAAQLAAAVATLSGRGGGGIVNRLRENVGLDDLDVTTSDTGGTSLRAGRYLSDNLYTDATIDSDGETEINLNLDVSSKLTVKGSVTSEGSTGIGIFFERDY